MSRKVFALILALSMVLTLSSCADTSKIPPPPETAAPAGEAVAESAPAETVRLVGTVKPENINKNGNVTVVLDFDEFMQCFDYGDILTVSHAGGSMELPLCSAYTDVAVGEAVIIADAVRRVVKLAQNAGNYGENYGMGTKLAKDDGSFEWQLAGGANELEVTISLYEKAGYLEEYSVRSLVYTNDIADYPELSENEFANFRMVRVGNIAEGVLYRSASPIDPKRKRNTYSDKAASQAGITRFIDLADSESELLLLDGYEGSYFSSQEHIAVSASIDISSPDNREKFAKAIRYIAENKGIYGVFCLEGKDRTGFVVALIECLMGASAEEVKADYMQSFYNYYGVKESDLRYELIFGGNLYISLSNAFDAEFYTADLAAEAEEYLLEIGLTEAEIAAVRANLSA